MDQGVGGSQRVAQGEAAQPAGLLERQGASDSPLMTSVARDTVAPARWAIPATPDRNRLASGWPGGCGRAAT